METMGERIKYLRKQKGLTQDDLSKKLNTSSQNIWKYEHGVVKNIPLDKLLLLADALDTDILYLQMGFHPESEEASKLNEELNTELIKLIGYRIRKARKQKGLSQVDLANKLNTSSQNIWKYENGYIVNIPVTKIFDLAYALEVPVEYLLTISSNKELLFNALKVNGIAFNIDEINSNEWELSDNEHSVIITEAEYKGLIASIIDYANFKINELVKKKEGF